jgi:hypothetical protein
MRAKQRLRSLLVVGALLAGGIAVPTVLAAPAHAGTINLPTDGTSSNGCLDLWYDVKANLFYQYQRIGINDVLCDGYEVRIVDLCYYSIRGGSQINYSYGAWISRPGQTSRGRCSALDAAFPHLEYRYVGPL